MRKYLLFALILVSLVLPLTASDWQTGVVVNPGAGAVVADTGPLPADGNYKWCVWGAASVSAVLRVQHRDATNTNTLHEYYMPVGAGQTPISICTQVESAPLLLENERLRVINNSLIAAGTVSASIMRSEP